MKICLYLSVFGPPNLEKKLEILSSNIKYLEQQIEEFDIFINFYSEEIDAENIVKEINKKANRDHNIRYFQKKGMLLEVIMPSLFHTEKIYRDYDLIIMILDDILFVNMDIERLIRIKKQFNIEVLSPKIINATHEYMENPSNKGPVVLCNNLEFFCYILTPKDYEKYFEMFDIKNKYMWGIDLLFGYYKIRAGIDYNSSAEHFFRDTENLNNKKRWAMIFYLLKHRLFGFRYTRAKFPPIIETLGDMK